MATIYISPTGAAGNSGSSAAAALPITSLDKAIQLAGPGGTVLMLADQGSYNVTGAINISHGGTAGAPVTIMGVDSAGNQANIQINGTRPANYSPTNPVGNETFKLFAGANNLVFENMNFANVGTAFRAGGDISNITVKDMTADNVRTFFEDYASGTAPTATISGLTIQNVEVHGFSKFVVRLQYDTHDVLIQNVHGDSERQDDDGIAMGISLSGTVHHVMIDRVTMENALSSGTYYNGDGFATEWGVYDVTFKDTIARGNADGGYDLKSTDTTLINAVAEGNGRNFRIWGEATLVNPTGLDPYKQGGSGSQLQIQVMEGAQVAVTGGSFSDSGSATKFIQNIGGQITFTDTIIIHAAGATIVYDSPAGIFGLDQAIVTDVAASGTFSHNGVSLLDALHDTSGQSETGHIYKFDIPGGSGNQSIHLGFDDVIQTNKKIFDSNNDGIITFGANGLLDIEKTKSSSGDQKIAIDGAKSLRLIGSTSDGSFVYEDAALRPKNAIEGTVANNAMSATAKSDVFFFNNAIAIGLGNDTITGFSAADRIVTTQALGDSDQDGLISAGSNHAFEMGSSATGDGFTVIDGSGHSVDTLQLDGTTTRGGVTYYIYSMPGDGNVLAL